MNLEQEKAIVSGYVIAGGQSRRMGVDKRTLEWDGLSLLERSVLVLEQTLGEVPKAVGDNPVETIIANLTWLPDARPNCGPLGGLVAALGDVAQHNPDFSPSKLWALVLAVDMPAVTCEDLAELLRVALTTSDKGLKGRPVGECEKQTLTATEPGTPVCEDVICLGIDNRPEPLAALYSASTLYYWNQRLERQSLSLRVGLNKLRVQVVEPARGVSGLRNLNSIEDVQRYESQIFYPTLNLDSKLD